MTDRAYTISKAFSFDAAHHLDGLPVGHKCARPHGHTYTVIVALSADTVDDVGMVLDYGELAPVKAWVDAFIDHRDLNDVFPAVNPTAENLARLFACLVVGKGLAAGFDLAVTVKETPATAATFFWPDGLMSIEDANADLDAARGRNGQA